MIKYIKTLLAIIGFLFGGFLMGYAYTTNIGNGQINGILMMLGLVLSGGCILYLLIKFINAMIT